MPWKLCFTDAVLALDFRSMRLREIPNKVRFQVSAEAVNSNSSGSIRECVDHCDAKGGSGAGRAAAKDEGTGLLAVHSSYYPEEGERKEPKCRAWKRDRIQASFNTTAPMDEFAPQ